jgi:DNA polymerase-4
MRKIIHLDMDCFYAAVEMRDHAFLRGRPMAVGGSSRRGVLTTCNYEARAFGCRSAMPTYKALELCPELLVVPPRFDIYRAEAEKIRAIMFEFTELVEPLSLDEAFLDLSHESRYAWDIAKELRKKIFTQTGLSASAGIAPNKLLAKIASDWKKPNGQFAVRPEEVSAFMKKLPVAKLWGIGPKSCAKLLAAGIRSCEDAQNAGPTRLEELLGSFGSVVFRQSQGIDEREVRAHRVRKSISTERTFEDSLRLDRECLEALPRLFAELRHDVERKASDRKIAKLFVRLKFDDFQKTSRECLGSELRLNVFEKLLEEALARRAGRPVRLIGAGVRFVEQSAEQLEFDFACAGSCEDPYHLFSKVFSKGGAR